MKLTKAILHEAACAVSDIAADYTNRAAYTCFRIAGAEGDTNEYIKLALACGAPTSTLHNVDLGVFEHAIEYVSDEPYTSVTARANNLRFDFLYLLSKAL